MGARPGSFPTDGLQKVVWAEGIFLGQQHFQQWDRYIETCQQIRTRSLNPLAWGVVAITVDERALENGRFQIHDTTVIFPDGQLVVYTGEGNAPLACQLEGDGGDSVDVYLAQPASDAVAGITGYPPATGRLSGWQADYCLKADAYDSQRQREVLMARPNLVVMAGDTPRDHFVWIKIAEAINEGDGSYRLEPSFVPPTVRLAASPYLLRCLGQVVEMTSAKHRHLLDSKSNHNGGIADMFGRDAASAMLLVALGGAMPQLIHLQAQPDLHPESAYGILCGLHGHLTAIHPRPSAGAAPPYRHDRLSETFTALLDDLSRLLDIAPQSRTDDLVLTDNGHGILATESLSESVLAEATFFLQVATDLEDPAWVTAFARQVKVGAKASIETIVASALTGVPLVHTQRPPNQLTLKSGCEYFRLESRGDHWEAVVDTQRIAVFLPQGFSDAAIELMAVKE